MAEAMLATWPAQLGAAARRRLASLFLAAGEQTLALMQWLRLPVCERRAGDGLDDAPVTLLNEVAAKPNENFQLAAIVAARSGLERVHAVDDHTSDAVQGAEPAFGVALREIWSGPNPVVEASKTQPFASPADMLASYRLLDTPRMQIGAIETDFGRAIRHATPRHWGRQYVGRWKVRNLRMVGNIRATFVAQPGARMLTVVGALPKPYFDAYLDPMPEVRLGDAASVLR